MGIGSYATASSALAQELAASLTTEDVQALAADVASIGLRSWTQWQCGQADEVQRYVAAPPGQRAKKTAWREPALRRRLVLAAVVHCHAAAALLEFLTQHQPMLEPGGSYRGTTAAAGRLYWELAGTDIPDWPEEFARVCPSPFAGAA